MRTRFVSAIIAVALSVIALASKAQTLDEVIVTGTRIAAFSNDTVPAIHLKRRADFMVINAYIESDSRTSSVREKEVRQTLQSLHRRAKGVSGIELGLIRRFETDDDELEYVVPFDLADVEIGSGYRPDTSRVRFIVKSPITDSDETPDAIYERIQKFMNSVDVTGRAVVDDDSDPSFSLVNVSQYREPLLKMLAADIAKMREIFGDNYQVWVSGLEEPVRWRVTGAMELTLYFPYSSSLQPQ